MKTYRERSKAGQLNGAGGGLSGEKNHVVIWPFKHVLSFHSFYHVVIWHLKYVFIFQGRGDGDKNDSSSSALASDAKAKG